MYKTSVYTLVNGNIRELAYRKQQKSQKVILPASHRLCVSRGEIRLAAFAGPSLKTPYRRKNLADIFYTDRVIASVVSDVVAMATRKGLG